VDRRLGVDFVVNFGKQFLVFAFEIKDGETVGAGGGSDFDGQMQ